MNYNYCKEKYDMFGISSLLFSIPFIYSTIVLKNKWGYKMFLFVLPIISYYCNTNYNDMITLLDYTTIFSIFISYLVIIQKESFVTTLLLLYMMELMITKNVRYTIMAGYSIVIYCIILLLKEKNKFLCSIFIISVIIGVFSFIKRDCYKSSYKLYTLLWHTSCSIILCIATNTIATNTIATNTIATNTIL